MQAERNRFLDIFRPDRMAESVADVDPAALIELGIEALLIDLDNTLVPWRGYEVSDEVLKWLREVESHGIKLCIVSNTLRPGRLERLSEKLRVPFVKGRLKPRKSAFRPALELLNVAPERSAVIGDQVFTDILGGNRLGIYTILVRPLSRREFFGTKVSRVFERLILRRLHCWEDREQSPGEGSQSKAEW